MTRNFPGPNARHIIDRGGPVWSESATTFVGIPDLGEVPMEAAILAHVHPLGLTFRPGGGQALPLPTVNLPTLYVLLHMIAVEIHHQLN